MQPRSPEQLLDHEVMASIFSALSEPNRLRIVAMLRQGPRSVGELVEVLDIKQPQVSKHLRILKDASLVEVEGRAQQRIYSLCGPSLERVDTWLEAYRSLWTARMDELEALVFSLVNEESP